MAKYNDIMLDSDEAKDEACEEIHALPEFSVHGRTMTKCLQNTPIFKHCNLSQIYVAGCIKVGGHGGDNN